MYDDHCPELLTLPATRVLVPTPKTKCAGVEMGPQRPPSPVFQERQMLETLNLGRCFRYPSYFQKLVSSYDSFYLVTMSTAQSPSDFCN